MTLNVTIREATLSDATEIQRVAHESWHAAYDSFLGEETVNEKLNEWYTLESITHDIEHDEGICYVAEHNDQITGFAITGPSPESEDTFQLYRIYVLSEYWNKGIGGRLLDQTFQDLVENDIPRIQLGVLAENDIGVSFYGSQGFERIEESEADVGDGIQEYTYMKEL